MQDRVLIFDTTLRDGEQAPGFSMNLEGKVRVAKMLESLGVDIIEAGFPVASQGDFESVLKISESVKDSTIAGLARARQGDIEAVAEATQPAARKRIHTFISTSPLHMKHKLQMEPEKVLEMVKESVSLARNLCDDVEFSAEDATRTEHDFLCRAIEIAIDSGASTVNIPDTVGYTTPDEYRALIKMLKERVPNIDKAIISTHCHNDLGLAVANSLAGVEGGARQIECTINGIGERAGNAALEEIIMAFYVRKDVMPFNANIDTTRLTEASHLIGDVTGFSVQPNKAIVGANAFAHESGIHQDGMLKNAQTYEIMTPETVGLDKSTLVLGKHSGRNAFRTRLANIGFELSQDLLDAAFKMFKDLADEQKKISDDDLTLIVRTVQGKPRDRLKLITLNVNSSNDEPHRAEVKVNHDGEVKTLKAVGAGPVDACFKALKEIVPNNETKLHDYDLKSIDEGSDARGDVRIALFENEKVFRGHGVDKDIVVASVLAYIDALNKLIADRDL